MEGLAKYMIIFIAVLSTMYFLLFLAVTLTLINNFWDFEKKIGFEIPFNIPLIVASVIIAVASWGIIAHHVKERIEQEED
ncbi:MAG: hypothetical protein ACTHJ0_16105 [Flavipsychrobacter sp.]